MLAASIHEHAGLGNQIWRYVCCRAFAERLGYDWGVSHPGWRGPFLNMVSPLFQGSVDHSQNCGFNSATAR